MSESDPHPRRIVIPTDDEAPKKPTELPIIVVSNQVVFPPAVLPVRATAKEEHELLDDAAKGNRFVGMVTRKPDANGEEDKQSLDIAYEVGCICRILQLQGGPDGSVNVLFQAVDRFRIKGLVRREPYLVARIEPLEVVPGERRELAPLAKTVKNQMIRLVDLSPNVPDNARQVIESIEDPGFLADLVSANLPIGVQEKQQLLETLDSKERLERLTYILAREVEVMEISDKIQSDVKSSINESQREFYLRQQLRAIQEELGEGEGARPEIEEYREKLAALDLREEVRKEAERELDRLSKMNEASAEYHVITTYLDWVTSLPWDTSTEDNLNIDHAEQVLNEDHYGLDKVKKRILEYLAVRKLKPDAPGPILCFLGPPGVGKTSLGQSIARAMGRKFMRMSLGGMRDEAEIRGHRKTYVGALPGRIIQGIHKAGTNNPVFMLDELDKVGTDFRGDPSSALLEVLDPAQNDTFTDHYLNVPFDLSRVMFVGTANMIDTIPWALRDRMEIIDIPGYTLEEKLAIAKRYLVPRQLDAHGLMKKNLNITDAALKRIIGGYTREAGVRNLEREVGTICRGVAARYARGRKKKVSVGVDGLAEYLGNPKVHPEVAERTQLPGVATGLSWTAVGGAILFIEATRMPGKGNLVLTGQLGDVMRESAQAVMSYVRANAGTFKLEDEEFSKTDIHIHVPAGAVPKDGPSAGVTMLAAVVSLLTGKRVKNRLAMTGEITLRGLVLPVGGIKEKVLAASRAGIREVILPERNLEDLEEVPASAKKKLKVHGVERMDQVLSIALGLKLQD